MAFSNVIKSIFGNKCPKCNQGQFWASGNPYVNLLKHRAGCFHHCTHCGLKYEREIGFWYGAMYMNYALGVALFVAIWAGAYILFEDPDPAYLFTTVVVATVLFLPVMLYLSRLIWINIFVKFDKDSQLNKADNVETPEIVR